MWILIINKFSFHNPDYASSEHTAIHFPVSFYIPDKPCFFLFQVTGWMVYFRPNRPFPIDMAGFAVNMQLFFDHPDAWFSNNVQRGYQESTILKLLGVTTADLEPRADKCTKV